MPNLTLTHVYNCIAVELGYICSLMHVHPLIIQLSVCSDCGITSVLCGIQNVAVS